MTGRLWERGLPAMNDDAVFCLTEVFSSRASFAPTACSLKSCCDIGVTAKLILGG